MVASKVGPRMAKYMAQNDISMEALAERTGLSITLLTSIRDDEVYPSLGPLVKIARALGVRLGTFLDDQGSVDPLIVRRADRRSALSTLRAKDRPVETKFYSLGRGKTDRHMEPFYVELLPESAQEAALSSHEGEEFIFVMAGELELTLDQKAHVLKTGEHIHFNSYIPHRLKSLSGDPTRCLVVLYTI